jgi:hypothetical protein
MKSCVFFSIKVKTALVVTLDMSPQLLHLYGS